MFPKIITLLIQAYKAISKVPLHPNPSNKQKQA
uniref:Uncharacterized protein n=1 Tax=Arundo donax TaxID=35708 RepID=A0A0A9C769_ARUDO